MEDPTDSNVEVESQDYYEPDESNPTSSKKRITLDGTIVSIPQRTESNNPDFWEYILGKQTQQQIFQSAQNNKQIQSYGGETLKEKLGSRLTTTDPIWGKDYLILNLITIQEIIAYLLEGTSDIRYNMANTILENLEGKCQLGSSNFLGEEQSHL